MSYVKLWTYMSMRSKIMKQVVKLFSMVCPLEGFKSMGIKAVKMQEICELSKHLKSIFTEEDTHTLQ